jgi:predicted RNase H-like HicB family nuclease
LLDTQDVGMHILRNTFTEIAATRSDEIISELPAAAVLLGRITRSEFTAVFERDGESYIGYCPEVPGAYGQGRTLDECRSSLRDAISLVLADRHEDGLRGVPADVVKKTVIVE